MSPASLRSAGILLILLPTVVFGGVSILTLLIRDPRYRQNPLRQQLWRAGHAHAGNMLIISSIASIYVDQTDLTETWRNIVRMSIPAATNFLPAAFFLSVLSPAATKPNILINLACVGAISLTFGLIVLGVGLL